MTKRIDRDVVIVGAGFAGLYMLHRLRLSGFNAHVFERGAGVGGTWFWNRYPGARCDVESLEYSYGFDDDLQETWRWSERYAAQPEILRYLQHVAERFRLLPHITFGTSVVGAAYDEQFDTWKVRTSDGEVTRAAFLVMATGCLSSANVPAIGGLDRFAGSVLHTGKWPQEGADFAGQRVAVVGTGSSAIQLIPIVAGEADRLVVLQRTASYSVPARNRPLTDSEVPATRASYRALREWQRRSPSGFGVAVPPPTRSALTADTEARHAIYEESWHTGGLMFMASFTDLVTHDDANWTAAEFIRQKIDQIVGDARVASLLKPRHAIGCKRLCLDSGYYETFNRSNVELVDVAALPITAVTTRGIQTTTRTVDVDCIVFATGFDAMTGSLLRIDIRGRHGLPLETAWREGPINYLGLGVPGFPNMFTVTGPGSPSVLTNMVASIEHHVEWISDCIRFVTNGGHRSIEATDTAAAKWVAYVNAVAGQTIFPNCNSWYLGANIPGKPRVFMPLPGLGGYVEQCGQIAAAGYSGFDLR